MHQQNNIINLLTHPKFLGSKAPQEEEGWKLWTDKLTDYFKNQPVMTVHYPDEYSVSDIKGKTAEFLWIDDFVSKTPNDEDDTPDYLIVMDLLEDCIKDGNYRSAKAAVEMLDDIVERIRLTTNTTCGKDKE